MVRTRLAKLHMDMDMDMDIMDMLPFSFPSTWLALSRWIASIFDRTKEKPDTNMNST